MEGGRQDITTGEGGRDGARVLRMDFFKRVGLYQLSYKIA